MDPVERFRMLRSDDRWTPAEHRFTPTPRLATADAPRRWWAWAVPAVVVAAALAALAAFTLGGVLTLGQGEGPAAPTTVPSSSAPLCDAAEMSADFESTASSVGGQLSSKDVEPIPYVLALTNNGDTACGAAARPRIDWNDPAGSAAAELPRAPANTGTITIDAGQTVYADFVVAATPRCPPFARKVSATVNWGDPASFDMTDRSVTTQPKATTGCPAAAHPLTVGAFTSTSPRGLVATPSATGDADPICQPGGIVATIAKTAASDEFLLGLKNAGSFPCRIPGAAKVSWNDGAGDGTASRKQGLTPPEFVDLPAGGVLYADIEVSQSSHCPGGIPATASVDLRDPATDSPDALPVTTSPIDAVCPRSNPNGGVYVTPFDTKPLVPAGTAATLPPTTTPASDIPFCTPAELDGAADSGGPAMGTWHTTVRLSYDNGGGSSCKVTEVPSVQWLQPRDLTEGPLPIGPVVKAGADVIDAGHDYVLKPGDSVWVTVAVAVTDNLTANGGSCVPITPYGFQLTLPGEQGTIRVPFSATAACADGRNLMGVSQIGYTPLGDDPASLAKPSAAEIGKCDPENIVGEELHSSSSASGLVKTPVSVTNFGGWCYLGGFPVISLSDGTKSYGAGAAHDNSLGNAGRVDIGPGQAAYFVITQRYPSPPVKAPLECSGPNHSPSGFQLAITGYGSIYVPGLETSAPCAVDEGAMLSVSPYAAKNPVGG